MQISGYNQLASTLSANPSHGNVLLLSLPVPAPFTDSFPLVQALNFSDTDIPVFFSEYGSNTARPRVFHETTAIYSSEMTHVFSGACVYEFYQGPNRYGIVEITQLPDETKALRKTSEFRTLKKRLLGCTEQPVTYEVPATDQSGVEPRPFPTRSNAWKASSELPHSPVDWEHVRSQLDLSSWVVLEDDMQRGGTVAKRDDDFNLRIQVGLDLQLGRR